MEPEKVQEIEELTLRIQIGYSYPKNFLLELYIYNSRRKLNIRRYLISD